MVSRRLNKVLPRYSLVQEPVLLAWASQFFPCENLELNDAVCIYAYNYIYTSYTSNIYIYTYIYIYIIFILTYIDIYIYTCSGYVRC